MTAVAEAVAVRRIRYRLKRQGMAELDVWLAALEPALDGADEGLRASIAALLACEPPRLLAMMHGEEAVPEPLRHWLDVRA